MEVFSAIFCSTSFWLTALVFVVYLYFKYVVYNVWSREGVPHDRPLIPLGNIPFSYIRGKITHGAIVKQSYDKYKKHPFHGIYIFFKPVLVINDPDLLQLIMIKHFANFRDKGVFSSQHKDPLSTGLVRLYGGKWKKLRGKLSPTFTSGKLKQMYPLLKEICDELINVCEDTLQKTDVIELKELSTRYTVDCISSIAYGFNCNSLKNSESDFLKYGKLSNYLGRIFILISFYMPELVHLYPVPKKRQSVQTFFVELFEKMVNQREKDQVVRNDFLNMLIQLMNYGKLRENDEISDEATSAKITENDKLTMTEAMGQAFLFFAAGQETTSSVISCCLYELAFNQDVQDKLYREIKEVNDSTEGLKYETFSEMVYLDMVYHETLRKYPAAAVINRICNENFDIPNMNFRIKKGTRIIIPISGLHNDPDIYPNPEEFDPERFTPENKAKRHNFTYLPFGEGPRQCIGKRFGILKPKIALFYLVLNYKFLPCDETAVPIKYSTEFFVQIPENIHLKLERRDAVQK